MGLLESLGISFHFNAILFQIDPRDEKIEEMERMVASYQDKLDTVTTNYEEKVNILEGRIVDKDMSNNCSPVKNGHGKLHNQHGLYHSQGKCDKTSK